MRMLSAIFVTALMLPATPGATGEERPDRSVRDLSERLGLTAPAGEAKCGFPVTAYVMDHAGKPGELEGLEAYRFLARPLTQTNVLAGDFRIHFDTSGVHEPALLDASGRRIPGSFRTYVDSVAAIAATVFRKQVVHLSYPPAPPDGGAGGGEEYDIYLQDLDSLGYYGRTVPEAATGRRSTTFMEIDNDFLFVTPDSLKGLPALRVTLAHEYHHAIQLGNYGYWGFDQVSYYEMTSVWMEDAVFPDVNDYFTYLSSPSGHFRRPEVAFTSTEFVMYSRGIWCHYLSRRFGAEMIRRSWEHIAVSPPLPALDAALREDPYNADFRSAFAEWTLWNAFTGTRADTARYYPEGHAYPTMTKLVTGFVAPALAVPGATQPLGARYHEVLFYADTVVLVVADLDFVSALAGDVSPDPYTVLLTTAPPDDTYRETAPGLFFRLDVADSGAWYAPDIVNRGVRPSPLRAGRPFPVPFRPGRHSSVCIPVEAASSVAGTLSIFASDMNLVHRRDGGSTLLLGNQVFCWDGRGDDGSPAGSGVYLFVLDLPDRRMTGKFVLIRN